VLLGREPVDALLDFVRGDLLGRRVFIRGLGFLAGCFLRVVLRRGLFVVLVLRLVRFRIGSVDSSVAASFGSGVGSSGLASGAGCLS
jgi:hypothetical protein